MTLARIQIRGAKEVQDEFRSINADQIPFATALALTRTAQDGQKDIQDVVLPTRFTLRRGPFMRAGIRIRAATKANLVAIVQDIHSFMELQETTGLKTPTYGRALAIPLRGARPTMTALIKDDDRPHAVMQRGGFIRNGVMYAVRQRYKKERRRRGKYGPVNASRQRNEVVPMYFLVDRWKWQPRYGFVDDVRKIVEQRFKPNFAGAFAQAVRTARR
jgi:hypothetical protein